MLLPYRQWRISQRSRRLFLFVLGSRTGLGTDATAAAVLLVLIMLELVFFNFFQKKVTKCWLKGIRLILHFLRSVGS